MFSVTVEGFTEVLEDDDLESLVLKEISVNSSLTMDQYQTTHNSFEVL